jgi:hypothetical protein
MFNLLFPARFDNDYRGWWLAVWLFVPVVLMKLAMGFNVAGFNPWVSNVTVMKTADAVPLDSFPAEAAAQLVFSFSAWGLCLFLFSLLGVLVVLRYRAMLPLMFLVLTLEQAGRKVLSEQHLIARATGGEMSFAALINWGFLAALVIGLLLSLTPRKARGSAREPAAVDG